MGSDKSKPAPSEEVMQVMTNNNMSAKLAMTSPIKKAGRPPSPTQRQQQRPSSPQPGQQRRRRGEPPKRTSSPIERSQTVGNTDEIAVPRDRDREKLRMLMMKDSNLSDDSSQKGKKGTTRVYESDSSSSSASVENSPHLSSRTADSAFVGGESSVRSSMRSIASSAGRISMVTEMNVSDIEVQSMTSANASPSMRLRVKPHQNDSVPNSHDETDMGPIRTPRGGHKQKNMNNEKTITNNGRAGDRRLNGSEQLRADSDSDFEVEELTQIKFKRISTKRKSKNGSDSSPTHGKIFFVYKFS